MCACAHIYIYIYVCVRVACVCVINVKSNAERREGSPQIRQHFRYHLSYSAQRRGSGVHGVCADVQPTQCGSQRPRDAACLFPPHHPRHVPTARVILVRLPTTHLSITKDQPNTRCSEVISVISISRGSRHPKRLGSLFVRLTLRLCSPSPRQVGTHADLLPSEVRDHSSVVYPPWDFYLNRVFVR